jgi:hypothetical protein
MAIDSVRRTEEEDETHGLQSQSTPVTAKIPFLSGQALRGRMLAGGSLTERFLASTRDAKKTKAGQINVRPWWFDYFLKLPRSG